MLASILSSSKEAFVIDNDMLGMINRTVRGVEVSDESLSLETIRAAVAGEGHFLGAPQTLGLMQSEYLYPQLANRYSPKEWKERGKPVLLDEARRRVREILAGYTPDHVPIETHAAIRERFATHLPMAELTGESRRWGEAV